jgi:hypothetical protein
MPPIRSTRLALHRALPTCRHADGTISSSAASADVRRMASEDPSSTAGFLLIVRTGRVVTCRSRRRVAPDTRSSQHIAGCAPRRRRRGGQRIYLRHCCYSPARAGWPGRFGSAWLSASPRRSDHLIAARASGVWPLRIPAEGRFPADCPHRSPCHCRSRRRVAPDTRSSQHIARFCNRLCVDGYSYRRRLPGLGFSASPPPKGRLTPPRNLPAPGRRQPLYVVLRLSRDLCFW